MMLPRSCGKAGARRLEGRPDATRREAQAKSRGVRFEGLEDKMEPEVFLVERRTSEGRKEGGPRHREGPRLRGR